MSDEEIAGQNDQEESYKRELSTDVARLHDALNEIIDTANAGLKTTDVFDNAVEYKKLSEDLEFDIDKLNELSFEKVKDLRRCIKDIKSITVFFRSVLKKFETDLGINS